LRQLAEYARRLREEQEITELETRFGTTPNAEKIQCLQRRFHRAKVGYVRVSSEGRAEGAMLKGKEEPRMSGNDFFDFFKVHSYAMVMMMRMTRGSSPGAIGV
jgi:hypothetical protein